VRIIVERQHSSAMQRAMLLAIPLMLLPVMCWSCVKKKQPVIKQSVLWFSHPGARDSCEIPMGVILT